MKPLVVWNPVVDWPELDTESLLIPRWVHSSMTAMSLPFIEKIPAWFQVSVSSGLLTMKTFVFVSLTMYLSIPAKYPCAINIAWSSIIEWDKYNKASATVGTPEHTVHIVSPTRSLCSKFERGLRSANLWNPPPPPIILQCCFVPLLFCICSHVSLKKSIASPKEKNSTKNKACTTSNPTVDRHRPDIIYTAALYGLPTAAPADVLLGNWSAWYSLRNDGPLSGR